MKKALNWFSWVLLISLMLSLLMACGTGEPSGEPTSEVSGEASLEETPDTSEESSESVSLMSTKDLCQALGRTVFSDATLTNTDTSVGLSDASIVGVDKDALDNEVLYPVPEDSAFAVIYNAADYGISPEATDNGQKINDLLKEIAANEAEGLKKLYFPEGTYRIERGLDVRGQKDFYFVAENVTFVVTGWFTFINYNNNENVHFNGFTLDYDPSPVVTGYVKECKSIECTLTIDEEFDLSQSIYNGRSIASFLEHYYDEVTGQYPPSATGNIYLDLKNYTYNAETHELTIKFPGSYKRMEAGTRISLAFANKNGQAFGGYYNNNMYWEHLTIYTNPGMLCYTRHGDNYYVNHVNQVLKEGSSRLMSSTSDGWHLVDIAGDVKITNSYLTFSLDDSFNILSLYRTIQEIDGKTLKCTVGSYSDVPFRAGDTLEVLDGTSLVMKDQYQVVSVREESDAYYIELDRAPEGAATKDLVGNDSRASRLYLHNNVIGNKRNRGILVQCRYSEISNNAFVNIIHGAVSLHAVLDQYHEAIVPRYVTIKNNKFIGNVGDLYFTGWGENVLYNEGIITHIVVENNFFCKNDDGSISLMSCSECEFRNNLGYNVCKNYSEKDHLVGIRAVVAKDNIATDNLFYSDEKVANFKVIRTTSAFSENTNNKYRYGDN